MKKVKKRALLLVNPKARRGGEAIDAVVGRLHRGGLDVTIEPFDALPEIARDIVRLRESADLIILCGGDGTIASGALAVVECGLPLGIIPHGHGQRPCPHARHPDGPQPGSGRDPCRQHAQDRPRHGQRPRLLQCRQHRAQRRPGAGAASQAEEALRQVRLRAGGGQGAARRRGLSPRPSARRARSPR